MPRTLGSRQSPTFPHLPPSRLRRPATSVVDPEPAPTTSINYLRKLYGPGFAPDFDDNDRLSDLLAKSGAANLAEYLQKNP